MKKKNIIIIAIIVVLVILLFPIPNRLKDGGTVEYKALLYTITDYHKIVPEGSNSEYLEGMKIEILGFEIFNSLEEKEKPSSTNNEERLKLEDLKIKGEDIDTTKLVKFNNVLYGKPNEFIDYAGDINKSIGKIDLLIGEQYLPQLDGMMEGKVAYSMGSTIVDCTSKKIKILREGPISFELIKKVIDEM